MQTRFVSPVVCFRFKFDFGIFPCALAIDRDLVYVTSFLPLSKKERKSS